MVSWPVLFVCVPLNPAEWDLWTAFVLRWSNHARDDNRAEGSEKPPGLRSDRHLESHHQETCRTLHRPLPYLPQ